jgi:hypothetical protein
VFLARAVQVAVWSYAAGTKSTMVQNFTVKGSATHCVFRATKQDEASNLVAGSRQGAMASATMIFIATDENRVYQCLDGKCTPCVTTHPKRICALLFVTP